MKKHVYQQHFKIHIQDGAATARLTSANIVRDMEDGLDIWMDFNIAQLENEIKHLPAYIRETFGAAALSGKNPDMILLRQAHAALKKVQEDVAQTPLDALLLDRKTEKIIKRTQATLGNRSIEEIVTNPIP